MLFTSLYLYFVIEETTWFTFGDIQTPFMRFIFLAYLYHTTLADVNFALNRYRGSDAFIKPFLYITQLVCSFTLLNTIHWIFLNWVSITLQNILYKNINFFYYRPLRTIVLTSIFNQVRYIQIFTKEHDLNILKHELNIFTYLFFVRAFARLWASAKVRHSAKTI